MWDDFLTVRLCQLGRWGKTYVGLPCSAAHISGLYVLWGLGCACIEIRMTKVRRYSWCSVAFLLLCICYYRSNYCTVTIAPAIIAIMLLRFSTDQ